MHKKCRETERNGTKHCCMIRSFTKCRRVAVNVAQWGTMASQSALEEREREIARVALKYTQVNMYTTIYREYICVSSRCSSCTCFLRLSVRVLSRCSASFASFASPEALKGIDNLITKAR